MVCQNINFKICLSLFSWKENILPKQHIVQWCHQHNGDDVDEYSVIAMMTLKGGGGGDHDGEEDLFRILILLRLPLKVLVCCLAP